MTAVCDTTPINYLILTGYVDVLPKLFDEILIPRAVAHELRHPEAPDSVRRFMSKPPKWVRILKASRVDPALSYLGTGEQEVIAIALTRRIDLAVVDERLDRKAAQQRDVRVVGTLAILDEAGSRGLLDFDVALGRLRQTSFRLSPSVLRELSRRLGR